MKMYNTKYTDLKIIIKKSESWLVDSLYYVRELNNSLIFQLPAGTRINVFSLKVKFTPDEPSNVIFRSNINNLRPAFRFCIGGLKYVKSYLLFREEDFKSLYFEQPIPIIEIVDREKFSFEFERLAEGVVEIVMKVQITEPKKMSCNIFKKDDQYEQTRTL